MVLLKVLLITGTCLTTVPQAPDTSLFEAPFLAMAGDHPVIAENGFAAPQFTDFDGDGLSDLLVGQRSCGKLLIYLNDGTDTLPVFQEPFTFQAAGADGFVPPG